MAKSLLISECEARMANRPERSRSCVRIDGINLQQKNAMRALFMQGRFTIGEVAKRVGVTYAMAKKALQMDDDLHAVWETTMQSRVDDVEQSMFDLAIDGNNEIAKEKAGEFILSHHRKQTYSDAAMPTDLLKSLPKIVIAPVVSRSPIQAEAIDVKTL